MNRISHRWRGLASLLVLAIAICGATRVVIPFNVDPNSLTVPRDARALNTHEAAVRGLTAILVRELGLPMPATFTLYVYGGRQPFEQGLVNDAQVAPARAAELSEFAVGIGKRRQLLLNDDGGQPRGREWLRADWSWISSAKRWAAGRRRLPCPAPSRDSSSTRLTERRSFLAGFPRSERCLESNAMPRLWRRW